MKICIITITNSCNFGGRLQNYALQEILKELFHDATIETAINVASDIPLLRNTVRFQIAEKILENPILNYLNDKFIKCSLLGKKNRFIVFNKNEINKSKWLLNKCHLPESFTKSYDFFICGSDQIWNPVFHFNSFVEFLPTVDSKKKMSYAASFGVNSLEGKDFEFTKRNIETFLPQNISVREEAGISILKELGMDGGAITLDPTLLLSREKWSQFEQKPAFSLSDRYVISYMLGAGKSEEAKLYAKEHRYEFIDICDVSSYEHYSIGPKEFVYLIHHADIIFTDSFHAMVFSIIFHKKARIYYREGMSSRIVTLFKTINKTEVFQSKTMEDYVGVDKCIEEHRSFSIDFLKAHLCNENRGSGNSK